MTEHPFIALAMALLVEGANWLKLRWNFDDTAYIRAWQISQISAAGLTVYIWLEEDPLSVVQQMISWLPALFLPVQLTQAYGLNGAIPISSFSFFARQRQLRNQRLGLRDTSTRINFGNVYLVTCMVASTLGLLSEGVWFLPGLLVLIAWAILSARQTRWVPLLFALAIASCIAVVGQASLKIAHERYFRYGRGQEGSRSPDVTETAIGSLGEIKQSPDIRWRLHPLGNHPPPRLLKTIIYNKYKNGQWSNQRAEGRDKDFGWAAVDETTEGSNHFIINPSETDPPDPTKLPSFHMRGAVQEEDQLPVPGDTAIIDGFKLEKIDSNAMGTIRINPTHAIIDGTVYWDRHSSIDPVTIEVPPEKQDLILPSLEADAILRVAAELGLHGEPTLRGKLDLISGWFAREFKYTRYLRKAPPGEDRRSSRTNAIAYFLTNNREGHCEYFATAASMLLRAARTPARYSVGYSVRELDSGRGEFIIRGTHAHAWCRVWDEEKKEWADFDPTPGNWLVLEATRPDWKQPYKDWFLRLREDFALWRTDSRNRMGMAIAMVVLGTAALIFIGRRLWRSRQTTGHPAAGGRRVFDFTSTPLHELEPAASEILGPRPAGMTFARWLSGLRNAHIQPERLDEAIHLHQRFRYDPEPASEAEQERLAALVLEIRKAIRRTP